uniref:PNPLA domain-containing protein n=1 Tax=viral metagenome TaxID=1070528 RepID=A0A6C0AW33_9ZZZZ|tara:strand:+ start:10218 stop:11036 length:819 start_codon:yes stop_codon:yes gene_type:complete
MIITVILFYLSLCNSFLFKNKISPDTAQLIKYNLGNSILNKIKNNIKNDTSEFSIDDKKVIKIAPGGLNGYYMMGICTYIKEHYDLDNYIFSGASAGAWNSLYMCYKGNTTTFYNNILNLNFENVTSILEIQHLLKNNIMKKFSEEDFDLNRLFIGVTIFDKWGFQNTIFSKFTSLEDAVECCIASSHIPLITGGFFNIYKNFYAFDGGFSVNPYIKKNETMFIKYNMWSKKRTCPLDIISYNITEYNFTQSFINGYNDSKNNKQILDKYLI